MKKLLTFCLLVVSVITLSACGNSNKKEEVHYADKDFLNSFVVGLQKRWDYVESDQGKKDSDDKYSDYIVKANEYELNSLKKYKDEKFKDSKLQEKAIAYINAINKNIDTAKKYTGFDLLEKSEASHSERTVILTEIIKEYKPKFDEKYQKYADDLMKKGNQAKEENAQKEAVNNLFTNVTFNKTDDGYGFFNCTATVENTTKYTIKNLSLSIKLIDDSNTVLQTTYASADNWTPGQKYNFEFGTDKNFTKTEISVDYFEIDE